MCKRKNPTDPLVRRFLETYNVNLLPLPRKNATPGEIYVQTGRKVKAAPGGMSELIEPAVELPAPVSEQLPDMRGVVSKKVERDFGLGLLGNFLVAVGVPPGIVDNVKAGYKQSGTAKVAFEFDEVTRDVLDPLAIGSALVDHRFKRHPWVSEGNRYFVAAGFVRSPSITIQAEDASQHGVELGVEALKVLEASGAVSAEQAGEGTVVYKDAGAGSLAIGAELYELSWDDEHGFLMGGQKGPVGLARGRRTPPPAAFPAPDDEALLEIEDAAA